MATYIPGIESYIPAYTPFEPDFKLTSMLMQQRQDRYDTNHKEISDLYGSVVYSDLSREDTKEQRDYFANQLTSQVEKISGSDLSLQQNVDAASGVFKPFLENKLIQQDIYRTSRYKSEMGKAQSFLKSNDPKQNDKFSELHLQALQFQMEDFVNASADEAMGMAIPEYVAGVNLYKEASEYLKESGIEVEDFYFTPDNKFIIKQKNGSLVEDVAFDAVRRGLSTNPRIQRAYVTDAYVKARIFAQNGVDSGKFTSLNEGKLSWAEGIIKDINMKATLAEAVLNKDVKKLTQIAERQEAYIKEQGEGVASPDEFDRMLEAKRESDGAIAELNETRDIIQIGSSELTSDQDATLSKAYAMQMNWNMGDDLRAAAKKYSMIGASRDIDINAYQKDIESHKLAMIKQRNQQAFTREQNRLNRASRINAAKIKAGKDDGAEGGNGLLDLAAQVAGGNRVSFNQTKNGEIDADYDVLTEADIEINKVDVKSDNQQLDVLMKFHQLENRTGNPESMAKMTVGDGEKPTFNTFNKQDEIWNFSTTNNEESNVPLMLQQPTTSGESVTLDEARVYYSKPENKKELDKKYNRVKDVLNDEGELRKLIPNLEPGYVNALRAQISDINGSNMMVENGDKILDKLAQENFNKVLAFDKYSGVPEVKEDIKNNVPKIVENGRRLTEQEFVDQFVANAKAGRVDGNFYTIDFSNETSMSSGYRMTGRVDEAKLRDDSKNTLKFNISAATQEAKEAYDRQKKVLNKTLNGVYNQSDANEDGSSTFRTFGVYDFLEGKSTDDMNPNSIRLTRGISSGMITPKGVATFKTNDPKYKMIKSLMVQMTDENSIQYVPGSASEVSTEDINPDDVTTAKALLAQGFFDLSNGLEAGDQAKNGIFSVTYYKNIGLKDSPTKKGGYEITFDDTYLNARTGTATGVEGSSMIAAADKNKFRTITLLVNDASLDVNPNAIDNYNYSEVDATIQASDDNLYKRDVINGGGMFIYKNQGVYMMGGKQAYFDPESPSYKSYTPIIAAPIKYENTRYVNYGELNGQPVRQNDIQTFADGSVEYFNTNAIKVTKQIEDYKAVLKAKAKAENNN